MAGQRAWAARAVTRSRLYSLSARCGPGRKRGGEAPRNDGGSAGRAGLFGSLLGGSSFFGGSSRAFAARTAGHAGGKLFKGKLPKGGSGKGNSLKRRLGGREDGLEPAGSSLPKRVARPTKGGRSSEITLASVLPLLLFAGVVGYGIYSANR